MLDCEVTEIIEKLEFDKIRLDLPTYNATQISSQIGGAGNKVWVTFYRGVFDITDFVKRHPGGERIMNAAGSSVSPFWQFYQLHYRIDVLETLAKFRIGNLETPLDETPNMNYFDKEPPRNPTVITRTSTPFCGETPPALLPQNFYTPNDLFYVRNHLPVPTVDTSAYRLTIQGVGIPLSNFSLSLDDVKQKFAKIRMPVTLQCGGNRRSQMGEVKPTPGIGWTGGAIGNAVWGGASLRDVLTSAGFNWTNYTETFRQNKLHIQFEGLDCDPFGDCYGASVPLHFLLDATYTPLLVYEMNNASIPPDHGFPLRALFPGLIGARSVKWVSKILISEEESPSPWQRIDYKIFAPSVNEDNVNFNSASAIYDAPVNSYICSHKNGEVVERGMIRMKGYAFAGRGRGIVRVELSFDNGDNWQVVKLTRQDSNYSWTQWEIEVNVTSAMDVWVKAVDTGYNQQPEDLKHIWNYRGLVVNAYHKIKLNI
ncbi:sulfite oxidase [Folsomia candida]|uniref:sulfite oxidase n=1 Tax=Folsomia candida TaxID=158441 RepID=UPI000B8FF082|nr:sulfite oxidase [Folsomia candida]